MWNTDLLGNGQGNGVIDVAILSIIRRWHFRDHVSLREIAKRLGVSRNTVRCCIRAGIVLPAYPERHTPASSTGLLQSLLVG